MKKVKRVFKRVGPLRVLTLEDGRGTGFSVHRIRLGAGVSHPVLHHARTAEFFLVTRGSARACIGKVRRRLRAGESASLPPKTAHGFRAGPRGVEVLAVFRPPLDLSRPDIVLERHR